MSLYAYPITAEEKTECMVLKFVHEGAWNASQFIYAVARF